MEQSIKCSLPSGGSVADQEIGAANTGTGEQRLQRRATQPCVSISSFKASISFLTTKHTARVRRPRPASYPPHRPVYEEEPLLPPLPSDLAFLFSLLFHLRLPPSAISSYSFLLLLLPSSSSTVVLFVPIPTFEGHRHPRLETLYATLLLGYRGWPRTLRALTWSDPLVEPHT